MSLDGKHVGGAVPPRFAIAYQKLDEQCSIETRTHYKSSTFSRKKKSPTKELIPFSLFGLFQICEQLNKEVWLGLVLFKLKNIACEIMSFNETQFDSDRNWLCSDT